jgi:hypothetical protein
VPNYYEKTILDLAKWRDILVFLRKMLVFFDFIRIFAITLSDDKR